MTGPINEQLKSEITKFRFGCILDKVPVNGLDVEIDAKFLLYNEEINVVQQFKVREREITQSPQYYLYIKEEIQRLQTISKKSSFRHFNLAWLYTSEELNGRIRAIKNFIVNLSTATILLSPLTAFFARTFDFDSFREHEAETQRIADLKEEIMEEIRSKKLGIMERGNENREHFQAQLLNNQLQAQLLNNLPDYFSIIFPLYFTFLNCVTFYIYKYL